MSHTGYQIKVKGWLNARWAERFDGLQLSYETEGDDIPVTVLAGVVPDQAALRGHLARLWDLGLTLISVNPLPESEVSDE